MPFIGLPNNSFLLVEKIRKIVKLLVFTLMLVFLSSLIFFQLETENEIQTYLDKSVPFVGTDIPRIQGIQHIRNVQICEGMQDLQLVAPVALVTQVALVAPAGEFRFCLQHFGYTFPCRCWRCRLCC